MIKTIIIGLLIGLFLPILGLYAGLQIHPWLGTLLIGPGMLPMLISGLPLGIMPMPILVPLASMAFWAALLVAFRRWRG